MTRPQIIASWVDPKPPAKIIKGRRVEKLRMLDPIPDPVRSQARAFLKLKTTEHAEQSGVIRWWAFAHKGYKLPEFALYAVPNGGARHITTGKMLKAEGVRKGALDLNLDVPAGGFHGLRIEMKIKPNTASVEQTAFLSYYADANYLAVVCWSAVEAIDCIKRYLARTI